MPGGGKVIAVVMAVFIILDCGSWCCCAYGCCCGCCGGCSRCLFVVLLLLLLLLVVVVVVVVVVLVAVVVAIFVIVSLDCLMGKGANIFTPLNTPPPQCFSRTVLGQPGNSERCVMHKWVMIYLINDG